MNTPLPVMAGLFGGWEVVMLVAVVLVLWLAKVVVDVQQRDRRRVGNQEPISFDALKLWVAQGFGIGWAPFAPGTFGTLLGIAWFALLVRTGSIWAYLAAAIEGIALSIWLCDEAEKILDEIDPGSVVLDEVVAMPFCFLPWVIVQWLRHGHEMAPLQTFFTGRSWWWVLAIFLLFRLFDIWKPWPIRGLQRLPGGWGVTVDDLLAAVYVAVVSLVFVR